MAKVMISLPDDLLARVDAEAERRGSTRSGVVRELVQATLDEQTALLARRMRDLADQAKGQGGDVVGVLKASRPA